MVIENIHDAAVKGHVRELRKFVHEDPRLVNSQDGLGATPLMWAAYHGRTRAVRMLLDHGGDPGVRGAKGITALLMACRRGHWDVARLLMERGADPTAMNEDGSHVLMHASFGGNVRIIRELLQREECRAQVNAASQRGYTALAWACSGGKAEAARVLLMEGGADRCLANVKGATPMDVAREKGHHECIETIQWFENELERCSYLYKTRRLIEDTTTYQYYHRHSTNYNNKYHHINNWTAPAYVEGRVERGDHLPSVVMTRKRENKEGVRRAVAEHVAFFMLEDPYTVLMEMMRVDGAVYHHHR